MSRRNGGDGIRLFAHSVGRELCSAAGFHRSGSAPRRVATDQELRDELGENIVGWVHSARARQITPNVWLYDVEYRPNLEHSHQLWCMSVYKEPGTNGNGHEADTNRTRLEQAQVPPEQPKPEPPIQKAARKRRSRKDTSNVTAAVVNAG